MTRLQYLQHKHKLTNITAMTKTENTKTQHKCKECARFHTFRCSQDRIIRESEHSFHLIQADDPACDDQFEQKTSSEGREGRRRSEKRQREEWELNLYAKVPVTLKPCGFFNDTLTEAVWLPYKKDNETQLRPSVILAKKDMPKNKPYKIVNFWNDTHEIKGTFPSLELPTLMSVKAVQMLESMVTIEPQKVDSQIEKAFQKHLSIPQPEMTVCKRWLEASFFYDLFDSFPIQSILGVSESGKSRLCMLNLALAYHGEGLIDPSEASIFRAKEEDRVTLIIDEAEYLNHPNLFSTLRILINASYSRNSGYVTRYDEEDGKRIKRRFDLYSPMCISGIAGLEGVSLSRAFRVVMRRTNKDFPKAYVSDYQTLRDFLYVLRIRHCFEVSDIYQKIDISEIVSARFEELFKPLFAMTKFLGSDEEHEILSQWCSDYEQNFRVEALNVAHEEAVLVCLSKLLPTQPDWYELKKLTDRVNASYNIKLNPKTVSNILYRLGFIKRKKVHGLTLIFTNKELLEMCASNIGIEVEPQVTSSFSSPNATTSTNSTEETIQIEPYPKEEKK